MDFSNNAVLIQGATLADIEAIVNRAVERRMKDFCDRIKDKPVVLVRRKEAAKALGVSLPTLDAYSKAGLLHSKHMGGRVFFDETEVLSFKNRCPPP